MQLFPTLDTEVRIMVEWASGKTQTFRKPDLGTAFRDAAAYEADPLGRIATVETREVHYGDWSAHHGNVSDL